MKQEKEWWEDTLRRIFHSVWGASPWNEERMTDSAIEVCKKLFQEATRRGIQQGKRGAWEELKEYCEEERTRCNRKMNEYEKDGKFGLQRQMDGEAVVHYTLARVLGDRLSALSNSQDKDL